MLLETEHNSKFFHNIQMGELEKLERLQTNIAVKGKYNPIKE